MDPDIGLNERMKTVHRLVQSRIQLTISILPWKQNRLLLCIPLLVADCTMYKLPSPEGSAPYYPSTNIYNIQLCYKE
jgi:hypothetical protein